MSTDVRSLIEHFPKQLVAGLEAGSAVDRLPARNPQRATLIVCGMGGSALPGLLLQQHIANGEWRTASDVIVHRNYGLPARLRHTADSLVLCISYSGNTEETLSAYREARRRRLSVAAIASGGTLASWAERDGVACARIPNDVPPRFGISYQFGAAVGLLTRLRFLPPYAATEVRRAADALKPRALRRDALRVATVLRNRIPVIYTAEHDAALGYVLKIQLNENAKIPAFTHIFPELNHNELNTYANLSPQQRTLRKPIACAILEAPAARPEVRTRMRITASLIRDAGVPLARIAAPGRTPLSRMLTTIVLGEWLSTALALSYGVDPIPTDLIETFKKQLRR